MSTFATPVRIWNPADPVKVTEIDLLVDTGASYSWISRERLERLGIRPTRRMQFRTIEGHMIEREMAPAYVASDGYIGGDTLVMAEPGDTEVMGAWTLESLGLAVDVVQGKLIPTIGLALRAIPRY